MHQGSGAIVDAIAKRLGDNGSKVIKDMFGLCAGDTVSSSIPMLLEHYAFNNDWRNTLYVQEVRRRFGIIAALRLRAAR